VTTSDDEHAQKMAEVLKLRLIEGLSIHAISKKLPPQQNLWVVSGSGSCPSA
jgi:hypothetical protein